MNKFSIKLTVLLIVLIINTISINTNSEQQSDNTSKAKSDQISNWSLEYSPYMNMKTENGTLVGIYDRNSTVVNEWRRAYSILSLNDNTITQFDMDFEFNFALMGEIYFYAYDNNGTTPRWATGYSDAWASHNGVPFAHSYQSNGVLYSESFPVTDQERDSVVIGTSSGIGHISVKYITSETINATVTIGSDKLSRILPTSGPIDTLKIVMSAAGSYNTATDIWKAYNFKENGLQQIIVITSTSPILSTIISVTSSTTFSTSNTSDQMVIFLLIESVEKLFF